MIIPLKKQCFIVTYSYQLVQDFATIHSMMVEIMEIYDFNDQLDLIGLMLGYASLGSRTTLKNRTKKNHLSTPKNGPFCGISEVRHAMVHVLF
jgi:hypothetical protein